MSPRRRIKRSKSALQRKAAKGFQGYPIATVAFYGPDEEFASKVAVGIVVGDDEDDLVALERWFAGGIDVRRDPAIVREIGAFIQRHHAKTVVMTDGILGCPHEEGIDYPLGKDCPECPFWAERDRAAA